MFPLRDDVTTDQVARVFAWFEQRGMILPYDYDGRRYLVVPTFAKYQGDTSREANSTLPKPPADLATTHVNGMTTSCNGHANGVQSSHSDADAQVDADAEGEAPAETPSPAPAQPEHDVIEPSTRKRHSLPPGKEPSDAVKTWLIVANSAGQTQALSALFAQRIDAVVTAQTVAKWRAVCEQWAARGYRMRNVDGMLAVFRDGWEDESSHAPPGNGSGSVRRRKDGRRESVYTEDELEAARAADRAVSAARRT
jgi:hypothetical protein